MVAGVFAAAALDASVLLGPVQLLTGGVGSGLRAVDGRTRQPGLGAPRSRGFLSSDEVPEAASVGVPALPAALAVAHASNGELSFARLVAPAIALAKKESEARRAVLERIARRGALALTDAELGEELVAAAGRLAGGVPHPRGSERGSPDGARLRARAAWRAGRGAGTLGAGARRAEALRQRPSVATRVVAAADGRAAWPWLLRARRGGGSPSRRWSSWRRARPLRCVAESRGCVRASRGLRRRHGPSRVGGRPGRGLGFAGPDGEAVLARMAEAFLGGLPAPAASPKEAAVGVLRTPTGARPL